MTLAVLRVTAASDLETPTVAVIKGDANGAEAARQAAIAQAAAAGITATAAALSASLASVTANSLRGGEALPLASASMGALPTGYASAGGLTSTATFGTSANVWLVGQDIAASGADINLAENEVLVRLPIAINLSDSTLAQFKVTFRFRSQTDPNAGSNAVQPNDLVIGPHFYSIGELGLKASDNGTAYVPIPGGIGGSFGQGMRVYLLIEGYAADGTTRKSFAPGRITGSFGALDQSLRGWSSSDGSTFSNVGTGFRTAFQAQKAILPAPSNFRWNCTALRQYRYRRRKRLRPTPEAVQNVIGVWGTSWSHAPTRWVAGFAQTLMTEQGDAGGGWTGLGFLTAGTTPYADGGNQPASINGNVRSTYTVTYVGTWTSGTGTTGGSLYGLAVSPDQCCAQSSTANDYIKLVAPSTYPTSGRAVDLHWVATANGVVEYSWDNLAWTTLNVQGSVGSAFFAALTGCPASGAVTLYIRVKAGTCCPSGVNWKSTASGVVFHKLAASGQNLTTLAATMTQLASWQLAVASLGINTAYCLEGTNDQGTTTTEISNPPKFADAMARWGAGVRAALPGCDILVGVEAENQRGTNRYPMSEFQAAALYAAASNGYAYYNVQAEFGDASNPGFYANGGAMPLFQSDGIHPDPTTGGAAMEAGALLTFNEAV